MNSLLDGFGLGFLRHLRGTGIGHSQGRLSSAKRITKARQQRKRMRKHRRRNGQR